MEEQKFTTVSIPKPLADKAKKLIEKTGFTSLSSFVEYLLREIVSESNEDKKGREGKDQQVLDLEDKLRKLGYM
ncbi:MAG: ribbon-helix-helix domain-containing protein [Candidatus Parvarchaeota archaeon]|jgi:Arc/MetJ-type ribon-helix-helix transcriptional regulator|nr:ribbon-helix-helix domain-containing protein [Candidatus Parvarchaeota archaeon]